MRRILLLASLLLALPFAAPARAEDPPAAPPPGQASPWIDWVPTLAETFDRGRKEGRPIFIAINAEKVDNGRREPAGQMLREQVYLDAQVVEKSRAFVCALLKSDGNSADYSEIRGRFAIDGLIVSPQHIFAHADGSLIDRTEYWTPRGVEASVTALLGMMDRALAAHRVRVAQPAAPGPAPEGTPGAGAPGAPPAATPEAAERRAVWIRDALERVRKGSSAPDARDFAIKELVAGDQKGDCIDPLCSVMLEMRKDAETRIAILKAVGRPGAEAAVSPAILLLEDKEDEVRSNAAVTLEYIGSPRAIEALTKRMGREKDETIASNVCRALGRCGAKQEAVRKALVKEMNGAKSDRAFAGPVIGLAYFEKDAEAARAIEKLAKKEAYTKRGFLLWALTEIDDPKSAEFVRTEVVPNEKNPLVVAYNTAVLQMLSGEDDDGTARGGVEQGMNFLARSVGGIGGAARRGRDQSAFKPKGEFGGGPGGGPGGRGGPGGGGGGMGGGGMGG